MDLGDDRVAIAKQEKQDEIEILFAQKNLDFEQFEMYLRAFKKERTLELWVIEKSKDTSRFIKLKDYPFCNFSGDLGPKRVEGDKQIPEGFYHIDRFNPKSAFHLSLGLNYPNASDKILSDKDHPGKDIFIHGACSTVGCIPITDDLIKELYIIALQAKNLGQAHIPVHIYPFKLQAEQIMRERKSKHIDFWANLIPAYRFFENKKRLPDFQVDDKGKYIIHEATKE